MDKFLKGFGFGASNSPNAAIILPEENEAIGRGDSGTDNPQYNNTTAALAYKARLLKEYSFESGWFQDQMKFREKRETTRQNWYLLSRSVYSSPSAYIPEPRNQASSTFAT